MKKEKTPKIVSVGFLTLITIVLWVIFGIIRAIFSPKKLDIPDNILLPFSAAIDQNILNQIGDRVFFTDAEIGQGVIVLETPEPTATPAIEEEVIESETQDATPSAEVASPSAEVEGTTP